MAKKRTIAEQKELYERWKRSGMSVKQFCKQNHISSGSLCKWCKEFGPDTSKNVPGSVEAENLRALRFYPIGKIHNSCETIPLEIALPHGITCKTQLSENSINILLREVLKCN